MKGRRLQSLLQRALAVQLVLAAVVVAAAVVLFLGYRSESQRTERMHETLVGLQALRAEILSAETALHGYAITREASFLEPYEQARISLGRGFEYLRHELPAAAKPTLAATEAVVTDWRQNFAERALRELRNGRRSAALALVQSGAGKRRIDRARRLVAGMSGAQRLRLRDERDRLERRATLGLSAIGFGALLLIACALLLRRWLQVAVVRPVGELPARELD